MNSKIFRAVSFIMAVLLCLSAVGCGKADKVKIEPMEPEEVKTFGFDFLGGNDVMTMSGYFGPMPTVNSYNGNNKTDNVNEKTFKALSEAGINHLSYTQWGDMLTRPEYTEKYFKYGEKYGIGITLNTPNSNVNTPKKADETIKPFTKYKSFCSVFVTDEPSGLNYFVAPEREIGNYITTFETLNELGYFPYCNLYPLYDEKQRAEYDEYLERYLSTCKPWALIYDHYVFDGDSYANYFYNMTAIREKAEKYGIPWWGFIGVGRGWTTGSDFERPTEYEYDWNINTYLAYGAKGLNFYLAEQNFSDIKVEDKVYGATRIAIIGAYGQKTRFWHYTKNLSKQIKAVDHILMNSVNKGVIATVNKDEKFHIKDAKYIMDGTSWRELKGVKGEAFIGCFNYNGKSAFYVVNYSREYAQHITLDFYNKYKLSITQQGEESFVETNSLKLDMKAGEGVLILVD